MERQAKILVRASVVPALLVLFFYSGCNTDGEDVINCPGNWDPSQQCNACKGNWDPDQDCSVCRNHWLDESNDCSTCPLHWDSAKDCNACIGNWDPDQDCNSCLNHWDMEKGCSKCEVGWTGRDCEKVKDCTNRDDFTVCQLVTAPDYWYDICYQGECISPGACGDSSCNVPGPHFEIPDTNLRKCYNIEAIEIECIGDPGTTSCGSNEYCGQDAQYGWDTEHESTERFFRTEDNEHHPVVTDTVTGLMWQGCIAGTHGINCQEGEIEGMTWSQALGYCDSLVWYRWNYDDWRLPDRHELQSIVDCSNSSPSVDKFVFPRTEENYFFSSSSHVYSPLAWVVDFLWGGNARPGPKSMGYAVRCVRGNPGVHSGKRFSRTAVVDSQPIVEDKYTGLTWQGCISDGPYCIGGAPYYFNWADALSYCENLVWSGYNDWRLPNVFELSSIVDDRQDDPAVDPRAFPGIVGAIHGDDWIEQVFYWTSTTYLGQSSVHWCVGFYEGTNGPASGGAELLVRCVRD